MKKEQIFEEMVNKSAPYVYSIGYRLTGSDDETKDLSQETFIKAWMNWHQLRNKQNPTPWLRRICINLFLDKKRKTAPVINFEELEEEGKSLQLVSQIPTVEDEIEADQTVKMISNHCFTAISSKLPLYQRVVFVLADIFTLSIDEVSELLGRSVSATKALLHRGRENMSVFFGEHCSLVLPENACRCQAWISFSHNDQQRRNELKPEFSQLAYQRKNDPAITERVISLFRTLPLQNPSNDWLEEIFVTIKNLK